MSLTGRNTVGYIRALNGRAHTATDAGPDIFAPLSITVGSQPKRSILISPTPSCIPISCSNHRMTEVYLHKNNGLSSKPVHKLAVQLYKIWLAGLT